jgi:hypothetical protein
LQFTAFAVGAGLEVSIVIMPSKKSTYLPQGNQAWRTFAWNIVVVTK